MGLRLWRDPDDDTAVAEDAAAKLDRAAAARRSSIRRESSIRPGRDHVPPQSISGFLRSRHQNMLRTRDRLRQEERDADMQISQLQAELERLRRIRLRNRVTLHQEEEASREGRNASGTNSPAGQVNTEGSVVANPQSVRDTNRQPLPRSPPESASRFELLPSSTSRSSSPWRYQVSSRTTMPSPPRSSGSARRDASIPDGPIPGESWSTDNPRMPALTEGFAPAHIAHDVPLSYDRIADSHFQGLETPPPEAWESYLPPLRRVSHNSPRPPVRVDGLGDRRRSLSSYSDHNEEDTWVSNLLTTMDTSRSSSATSFTSMYHDSARNSHNSSQTTSTSFGEIGTLDDTCELDLPDGITEDDARAIRERHLSSRGRHHQDRETRALRSLREHSDRTGDNDYAMFQAILDRMQRREPVPQDWWTSAGLPPDTGRRGH